MNKLPLRARLAPSVGGAASKVSRLAGRGDGSVVGGVIGLRLEPDLLAMLAQDRQVVLVTGTNGKTTTTRLVTAGAGPPRPGDRVQRLRGQHGGRHGLRAGPAARRHHRRARM